MNKWNKWIATHTQFLWFSIFLVFPLEENQQPGCGRLDEGAQARPQWMEAAARKRGCIHISPTKNGKGRELRMECPLFLINCMMVLEALHEGWWWKLILSGVLVPDMEVLTGWCHQKCGWMYGSYPKQAELVRLVNSECTYPGFHGLLGNGTPLRSPSRLSRKNLGRCHAPRPCDLWHDKQKAAKVRKHMEGIKSIQI